MSDKVKLQPIFRWAGGKRWLTKHLSGLLPNFSYNYHEPFLGSGAVFIHLLNAGIINNKEVFLSDTNERLINCYKTLTEAPPKIFNYLKEYRNEKDFYYNLRGKTAGNTYEDAAQFLYFNRTAFNGIYRVNLQGKFNVPYGNRQYKSLFDYENFHNFSLQMKNVNFSVLDFEKAFCFVNKGDFVFIDPPYTVAHNNNGFIRYNEKIFSFEDQVRLKRIVDQIDQKGAYYLLTNAHHENIYKIFSEQSIVTEINRFSGIGAKIGSRKNISEYLFTNYEVKSD